MGAQVVVTVLAVLWDGTRYLVRPKDAHCQMFLTLDFDSGAPQIWRFRKKGKMIEHSEKYTYLSGIFVSRDDLVADHGGFLTCG
eukprot:3399593-Rhodomonas_salina.2